MKKQITDSLIAFVLVVVASYVASASYDYVKGDCKPVQTTSFEGQYILYSVCKTPL